MNPKQKDISLLILLVLLLFTINYPFLDSALEKFLLDNKEIIVDRVIDGDTVVVNGSSLRLLGINCPEKGEEYYSEAKDFLTDLTLNKTLYSEGHGNDKYSRELVYLFDKNKNINLEIVRNGFANFYFPQGKDKYYNDFKNAWKECLAEQKNLCEFSKDSCAKCIELKEFDYENEIITFYNNCNFDCDLTGWKIKDEGRKNFVFPEFVLKKKSILQIKTEEGENNNSFLFWKGEDYVWTKTGDTLFLRNSKNKLVLWESY